MHVIVMLSQNALFNLLCLLARKTASGMLTCEVKCCVFVETVHTLPGLC